MNKTYTQKEVDSALNTLNSQLNELLNQRKHLNKVILEKQEDIKFYEELDLSQYKIL